MPKLPRSVVTRIEKLLAAGKSQKEVAQKLKLNITTVWRIANGKRGGRYRPTQIKGKRGYCKLHGEGWVPCVQCGAERYRVQHPEHEWVDPLPRLNARGTEIAISEQMHFLDELSQTTSAYGVDNAI